MLVRYKGNTYTGFTPAELENKGVPSEIISLAMTKEKWEKVRSKRDSLISDSDWTQIADIQLAEDKKNEFTTYRQTLRDLPQSTENPDDIVWPVKPE